MNTREAIAEILTTGFIQTLQGIEATPDDMPFAVSDLSGIIDKILAIPTGGEIEVIDESKLPLFEFDCGRGHPKWTRRRYLAQGSSYCPECKNEAVEYNQMLTDKGYNWPPAITYPTKGVMIEEGGDYKSSRPETLADIAQ